MVWEPSAARVEAIAKAVEQGAIAPRNWTQFNLKSRKQPLKRLELGMGEAITSSHSKCGQSLSDGTELCPL